MSSDDDDDGGSVEDESSGNEYNGDGDDYIDGEHSDDQGLNISMVSPGNKCQFMCVASFANNST